MRPDPRIVVVVLAVAVYAAALGNGFALDDVPLVRDDTRIRTLGDLGRLALAPYWPPSHGGATAGLYRPVATVSLALNHALTGPGAAGFHAVNVLLHALASLLAWYAARAAGVSAGAALVAAVLFAVHPLHAEAVVAIVGRAELLGTVCVLMAWLLHRRSRTVAAAAVYGLALLSKENTALAPLLFFAVDRITVRVGSAGHGRAPGAAAYAPYAIAAALAIGLRAVALGGLHGAQTLAFLDDPASAAGAVPRVLTALWTQLVYARLFFFPAWLSCDYSYDAVPVVRSLADPRSLAGLLWVAGLVGGGIVAARQRAATGAIAVAWWVAFFLPTANLLFPAGTILAERLAYLPSFGACLALGHAAAQLVGPRWRTSRGMLVAGIVLLATGLLAWRTIERVPDWRDNLTLALHDAGTMPRSAKLQAGAAIALHAAGRLDEAEAAYRRALVIYPDYAQMRFNLGQLLSSAGAYAEAAEHLARAAELSPHRPEPRRSLALLLGHDLPPDARRRVEGALAAPGGGPP